MSVSSKKIVYFDFLNVFACLCVIGMHCNGIAHYFDGSSEWKQSMVIETLGYWAVPVFFMLSGATLMNYRKRYSTKEFLKKRFLKTVLPFIVWSVGMLAYKMLSGAIVWQGSKAFVELFLNSRIEGVYWFFIPLFMTYLCLPILSKLSEDTKILKYMTCIGVASCILFPMICKLLNLSFDSNFYFPITRGYIIYVLLGYLLHKTDIKLPWRIVIYAMGILGAAFRYFHTVTASMQSGTLNNMSWGYNSLPCFVLAVAVFVFAKQVIENNVSPDSKFAKILRWLSGTTFGVYLMHVFVMRNIVSLFDIDVRLVWWRLVGPIILFVLCVVLVKLLQKIPFIGKIIIPS